MHVVIVGGGIVGCMTARELVKRGCQVTIVERNQIASQTSGESSWAGAGIVFPLLPWSYNNHVNDLTQHSTDTYLQLNQALLDETGIDAEVIQSGMLILPTLDEAAALAWCERYHQPHESVKASNFGVQSLSSDDALWLPTVCQARPPYMMKALRTWLEQHQVTLLEHTQLMPLQAQAKLTSWQTTHGDTIQADRFIVTSGAWSYELLKDTTQHLNIKPMRGQILLYQPPKNLDQIVYREGFYMVPRRDGYLLAGSTLEDVGFDAGTTEAVKEELMAKAEAIMPSLKGLPIIKHWSGLRPGTPENLPVISAHPHISNLYLNTGHFRYGLTMAPASARLVSDLVCETTPWMDASPFKLPL